MMTPFQSHLKNLFHGTHRFTRSVTMSNSFRYLFWKLVLDFKAPPFKHRPKHYYISFESGKYI